MLLVVLLPPGWIGRFFSTGLWLFVLLVGCEPVLSRSCCGLIGVDLIRFPLLLLFQEDDLFVGSPGSERLEARPRTLYWSLTMIRLLSEESPKALGIDENNTFQLQLFSSIKTVGAAVLGIRVGVARC